MDNNNISSEFDFGLCHGNNNYCYCCIYDSKSERQQKFKEN